MLRLIVRDDLITEVEYDADGRLMNELEVVMIASERPSSMAAEATIMEVCLLSSLEVEALSKSCVQIART